VHDAHELWVELPSLVGRPLIRWVWQLLAKALIPRSDATITVCQGIVEEMRARYGVNAAILRNLPLRLGPVSPLPLRERIGCAATTTLVIYQGGLLPGLGIDNAIDAMGLLPDGHLVIIGSGPLRDSLGARCDASPAKARITFLPAVPFKELPAYTAAANIGLFLGDSSGLNLQLALPNKLFEYIAAGVPVVATDWAEVRRIVLRYDVGILVPPGSPASAVADAIRHVAAKRDHYATNCRAAAEELTWENEVAVLGDVYDAVLGGGKTRLAGTRA
jgi:glycosyltransferase involved in cell wall biosynthesis